MATERQVDAAMKAFVTAINEIGPCKQCHGKAHVPGDNGPEYCPTCGGNGFMEVHNDRTAMALAIDAASGWRPIESAPKEARSYPIQICGGLFSGTAIAWWSGEILDATHWQPMAAPFVSPATAPVDGEG